MIKTYLQNKVIQPLLTLLKEGTTPQKLAASIVMGIAIGLFPILGTTTAIAAILAIVFRLNLVAIQIVNYAIYPIQLALIIPFIQGGATLFGKEAFPYTLDQLQEMFTEHFWETLQELGSVLLRAAAVWGITVIPLGFILYFILVPIFKKVQSKTANN
ncbi:DUF2062 domain-containing protein [Sediminitomix flava]|uniref:DUF2062 domain-containing protein n=1 Tax=Sediminitomix flava TaxID=379075 RepID=A0A315Z1R1_SEDFL|nr:DUF2062 domain-containing protein [Sediminitomix flava]PWJ36060.1 hypothetical protein BC781_10975 [Sediminitomix flava]